MQRVINSHAPLHSANEADVNKLMSLHHTLMHLMFMVAPRMRQIAFDQKGMVRYTYFSSEKITFRYFPAL